MKIIKMLLLGGAALGTVAFAAQEGILLRRTLVPNSTDIYKIDSKVDQTMNSAALGEMQLGMSTAMTFQIKTGKVDSASGKADVETTTTIDKVDAEGQLADAMKQIPNKPFTQTGKIDPKGQLTLDLPKDADATTMMLSGAQTSSQGTLFIVLPEKPVKVGDTWDITVPKGPFTGPEDQTLTAKLTGEKKVDGHDAWVVEVNGDLKTVFDSSKLPAAGASSSPLGPILIKGTINVKSEGTVDKTTGKTLTLTNTNKTKETVESTAAGLSFDVTGTITSTITLQS